MERLTDFFNLIKRYLGSLYYPATEWYFILTCLILACISYACYTKGPGYPSVRKLVSYLFPKSIYTHRSTRQDVFYIMSFPLIAGLIFKPALAFGTAAVTYQVVFGALELAGGSPTPYQPASPAMILMLTIAFTLLSAMAADLMFYFHHLLLHKIPFLWEFHKVHHSAEVPTPLTDYRAHPLEILTYGTAKGLGLGTVQGLFNYATGNHISVYTILGINALMFGYYAMGYALRHSHIWISYGPVLNHVFISPAQHQIHHSVDKIHWDKNFGGLFAIWDWAFGTLYVPKAREELTFGLKEEDQKKFVGVARLYVQPFINNATSPMGILTVTLLILFFLAFAARQIVWFFAA
ncbi:MAG: sterol desaturase family protein [Gammaproteobacteria bacterium]